jgi:hypothetical protein
VEENGVEDACNNRPSQTISLCEGDNIPLTMSLTNVWSVKTSSKYSRCGCAMLFCYLMYVYLWWGRILSVSEGMAASEWRQE